MPRVSDKQAKNERAQIRFLGSWSLKHANLAANSGSIRPLLTPAAVTADIEDIRGFIENSNVQKLIKKVKHLM
ncbi:hypothetical protein WN51_01259 [Melipona quadrifasciata]|uniref:Uncharacterized protein n=1 Tax=Melipona quadrifasciata TaxID=166423 RepID=A0A0N1ITE0_9HYME|nr:hypothetical protein WN51_01259 [Melipona quadrifasciata]